MRRLLAHRNARLYLSGQAMSLLGDGALWLAMGIWIKVLTGSSAAAGLSFFALALGSLCAPLGGMLVSDRLMEPFGRGTATFLHGVTFAGHPVSSAVALANLDVFEKEDLLGNVRTHEAAFRSTLEKLSDLPIVGDVRGDGYFYGIELVKDKATRETFSDEESERLLRGFLSQALFDAGLVCRADDRGDPVIQLAPPLTCTQEHFDEMEQILRSVLTQAWSKI